MEFFYKSTRGSKNYINASTAILKGIAEDGGLYVPSFIPKINNLDSLIGLDYKDLAYEVLSKFLNDFTEDEIKYCIGKAYDEKFEHEEIAPIRKVGDKYFLELFHGPTLAFKDMALSILPYLMKISSEKCKMNKDIVILTATSGDTGKAALEGFSNVEDIKIMVFYPQKGVSEIQKRQMVTTKGENTCVLGINGNFDDAQNGVKEIFNDKEFNIKLNENGYVLSSANSINIGRLVPQIVYYFYSYLTLVKNKEVEIGEKINVVVPTGNFGNILAAFYAKEMGLPINKLICASNENNVLYDFINSGKYDKRREFITTISPSMDILISSNLERLLYQLSKDENCVNSLMNKLSEEGYYQVSDNIKDKLKDFKAYYAKEEEVLDSIENNYNKYNYVLDPHTAVADVAYNKYKIDSLDNHKTIIVSTASPFKFTRSVFERLNKEALDKDDFKLVYELSDLAKLKIPKGIENLESREIIHNKIYEKQDMRESIIEFLNIPGGKK